MELKPLSKIYFYCHLSLPPLLSWASWSHLSYPILMNLILPRKNKCEPSPFDCSERPVITFYCSENKKQFVGIPGGYFIFHSQFPKSSAALTEPHFTQVTPEHLPIVHFYPAVVYGKISFCLALINIDSSLVFIHHPISLQGKRVLLLWSERCTEVVLVTWLDL